LFARFATVQTRVGCVAVENSQTPVSVLYVEDDERLARVTAWPHEET
jgi:hypothetical protein